MLQKTKSKEAQKRLDIEEAHKLVVLESELGDFIDLMSQNEAWGISMSGGSHRMPDGLKVDFNAMFKGWLQAKQVETRARLDGFEI